MVGRTVAILKPRFAYPIIPGNKGVSVLVEPGPEVWFVLLRQDYDHSLQCEIYDDIKGGIRTCKNI